MIKTIAITEAWFKFLASAGVVHVFSEKQFMPSITELYRLYGNLLGDMTIARLLGGDRKAIEEASGGRRDKIIDPKSLACPG
jgi:hypothetical protein